MDLNEMIKQTIENIKRTAAFDEIVGKPVFASDGVIVLPVSKLSYGFVVGGGEYGKGTPHPYAGVSGGGVTNEPLGFLILGRERRFVGVNSPSRIDDFLKDILHFVRSKKDE